MPIREYTLSKVLHGLEVNFEEFIDLCILLGCDYCDSIKGIGQKRALDLVKQYRNIETILKHIDTKVIRFRSLNIFLFLSMQIEVRSTRRLVFRSSSTII